MEANDGRCKLAVEEMGISDFDVANCGNSRSALLWKAAHGRTEGGRRSVEPPVEIKDSETITEEESDTETSIDSAYWLIPQASDCLISDEESSIYKVQFVGSRIG